MRIKLAKIPKKQFEKHYGKYAYGVSGKTNGHSIHIKKGIPKSKIKGTVHHELGHIFSETRRIAKKIPISERKRLIREKFFRERAKKSGAKTKGEIMEEVIADLYAYHKKAAWRKIIRRKLAEKRYMKTREIIAREYRRFKPRLVKD